VDVHDLKRRAPIADVWLALGGGKLQHNRGRAWWRGGDGPNVAIYPDQGRWCDFTAGTGGDVVKLVRTVRQCSFADAVKWLAEFAGVDIGPTCPIYHRPDTGWLRDRDDARYWRIAAEDHAEELLEMLPDTDPDRYALTRLLEVIRTGDLSMVNLFRDWRRRAPRTMYAMVRAGQAYAARQQDKLVDRIWEVMDGAQ